MLENKTILVTGGAGFIGSNLIKNLKKQNTIVSIDNYTSGKKHREHEGVTYLNLDCRDIFSLDKNLNPDLIYHFGEYSRVENSVKHPSKVFDNNIEGTYQVLKFSNEKKAKLIYAGSSTKFGDNGSNRFESPYAITKSLNTELVNNYCLWNKIDFAITYFYNVYGDGENEEGEFATVIGIFKKLARKNQSLTVVKPGNQKRNFTHISDIVEGLKIVGSVGIGDDYGIGSNESFSIVEVAKMFSSNIVFVPERPGNRMHSELNCLKTKQLGWTCKKNLKDYIEQFLKSQKISK